MWLKRASIWRIDNNRLIKPIDVCYLFLYRNDNYYQLSWWDVEVLLKIDACGLPESSRGCANLAKAR